jgi:hypothetical protein
MSHPLADLPVPFWVYLEVPIWPQNEKKKNSIKPVFWLFLTISPKRMALAVWLGAYLYA